MHIRVELPKEDERNLDLLDLRSSVESRWFSIKREWIKKYGMTPHCQGRPAVKQSAKTVVNHSAECRGRVAQKVVEHGTDKEKERIMKDVAENLKKGKKKRKKRRIIWKGKFH